MPAKLTKEEVVARIIEAQGDIYDFSNVVYTNNRTKFRLTCPNGHSFEGKPSHMMMGIGCKYCAWENNGLNHRMTQEEFINRSLQKHGGKYSYHLVNYVTGRTKVTILCNRCNNVFKMQPESHMAGQGCTNCSKTGYTYKIPGFLYVFHDHCDITKVGISNKDPELRCHDIRKRSGKNLQVLKTYKFEDGNTPPAIESLILKELELSYNRLDMKFNGSTECFLNVNLAQLLNRIEQLIQEYTDTQNNQAAQAA